MPFEEFLSQLAPPVHQVGAGLPLQSIMHCTINFQQEVGLSSARLQGQMSVLLTCQQNTCRSVSITQPPRHSAVRKFSLWEVPSSDLCCTKQGNQQAAMKHNKGLKLLGVWFHLIILKDVKKRWHWLVFFISLNYTNPCFSGCLFPIPKWPQFIRAWSGAGCLAAEIHYSHCLSFLLVIQAVKDIVTLCMLPSHE